MSSDWPIRKLTDVAEFLNHKRIPLKSLDRTKRQGPYPYYGASGVVDHIDDYIFDGTYLLISEDGENLRSRKTPIAFKASGKFWVNNHAHILAEKEEGILDYLEYYFSKLDLTPYITGAVQPKLNKANLERVEIPIPDKDERLAINSVLNSLSDKIDKNRQINQTLEQIAQGIFKSWFVDFEPVKAKIEAKQEWTAKRPTAMDGGSDENAGAIFVERAAMRSISGKIDEELDQLSPEQREQLTTTAALFPDELEDSELGEIPKGWAASDLKTVTTELRRGISPKYTEDNGIQVVNQKCIRNHSINFELTRLNDPLKRKVDGRQIEVGDVLVNSTGVGTLGRLAPVRYLPEATVFDSHVTVVRADTNIISKSYLAGLMLVKESFIEESGAGSTGQTELRKEVLLDINFAKPPMALGMRFDDIVGPMNKQIAELEQQQQVLAQLRDALLPKLLSGENTLSDTQASAEAVA